jgi:hypothetical protein
VATEAIRLELAAVAGGCVYGVGAGAKPEESMPSVTRDRKKYGAPTVYSEAKRQKEARELREYDMEYYRSIDERLNNVCSRVEPLIEDDQ